MSRLRSAILRWYRKHRRDLPWRRTSDPYAIWVSEVMLQQTRVETVIPFYERFLARFPTVRALAAAAESEVLAAWSGLGYYGRARSLRAAASAVLREHAGRLPDDLAALRLLPGIGDYTAAAIASVAFGRPAAAVDGNVVRVLARIGGKGGRRDAPALRREVAAIAEGLAPGPSPGDWTQALMELGALVCTPRDPDCARCPARAWCAACRSGTPDRYPEPASPKAAVPERHGLLLVARHRGRILLVPADDDAPPRGWTCPVLHLPTPGAQAVSAGGATNGAAPGNERVATRLLRKHLEGARLLGPGARFSHRTYSCAYRFEVWLAAGGGARSSTGARWFSRRAMTSLPLRAPTLKALEALRM